MKINHEALKKFLPFIVVGVGGGLVMFMKNKSSGSNTDSANTSQQDLSQVIGTVNDQNNQKMSALVDQMNSKMDTITQQTNQAFADQKTYYDGLTGQLKDVITQDKSTISDLTSSLHDIQNKESQLETTINNQNQNNQSLQDQVKNDQGLISQLTSTLHGLQDNLTSLKTPPITTQPPPQVVSSAPSSPSNNNPLSRVLKNGVRGDDVSKLQTALNNSGYHIAVDGIFGNETQRAVTQYQQSHGLQVDGQVYTQTWGSLFH